MYDENEIASIVVHEAGDDDVIGGIIVHEGTGDDVALGAHDIQPCI